MNLDLALLPGRFGVCRLDAADPVPGWVPKTGFVSMTRTASELSLICAEDCIPRGVRAETGWRTLEVLGPFDFDELGVLAAIAGPLRDSEVSLLAIATFDTDYVLIKEAAMARAVRALIRVGHRVTGVP